MNKSLPSEIFDFNGVDALTGRPLLRLTQEEMIRVARREKIEPAYLKELRRWSELVGDQSFDVVHGINVCHLDQAGWAVVWPHGIDEAIKEALTPLLDLRRQQAGERYHELVHRPGEPTLDFLARHKVGPGAVDPSKLPYYLLLVGSPQEIPFELQYRLDVQYAVGRLAFDDTESYANYARSVVESERGQRQKPRKISLIGPANPGDPASTRSSTDLVAPLAELAKKHPHWEFDPVLREAATKSAFAQRLGGELTPALAFVASHGLGYPRGHSAQEKYQGALVCQEWQGPSSPGTVPVEGYFAADDVTGSSDVAGLIAFFFACYGAGTPKNEDFYEGKGQRHELAERSFVARLPQRLLSHPKGGALAVVGHVERAWTYSFDWPQAGPQRQVFESAIGRLLDGYPIGAAMEHFGQRFAELAIDVHNGQNDFEYEPEPNVISIAATIFAFKDARSFVVLGDPAVRLAVAPSQDQRGS